MDWPRSPFWANRDARISISGTRRISIDRHRYSLHLPALYARRALFIAPLNAISIKSIRVSIEIRIVTPCVPLEPPSSLSLPLFAKSNGGNTLSRFIVLKIYVTDRSIAFGHARGTKKGKNKKTRLFDAIHVYSSPPLPSMGGWKVISTTLDFCSALITGRSKRARTAKTKDHHQSQSRVAYLLCVPY